MNAAARATPRPAAPLRGPLLEPMLPILSPWKPRNFNSQDNSSATLLEFHGGKCKTHIPALSQALSLPPSPAVCLGSSELVKSLPVPG